MTNRDESIREGFYQAVRQRSEEWGKATDRLLELVDQENGCSCLCLVHTFLGNELHRANDMHLRAFVPSVQESAKETSMRLHGWDTLRGGYGRRREVQPFGEWRPQGGRPKEFFLTEFDRRATLLFLDHARQEGLSHVDGALEAITVGELRSVEPDLPVLREVPALEQPQILEALAVVREVVEMDPGRYRRGLKQLAARVLAALVDSSVEATRKPFPSEIPDVWRLRPPAPKSQRREEAERVRTDGVRYEERLQASAESMDVSVEELRKRFEDA